MRQHISNNGDSRNVNLSCSRSRSSTVARRGAGRRAQLTSREADTRRKLGQKSRLRMSHAQNDARYVATGRMLALAANPDADEELRQMNRGKRGRPYKYADSLIMSLAIFRSFCGLSYRVCEGFAGATLGAGSAPDFVTIWERMAGVEVSIRDNVASARGRNGVLNMSIDGTGISPGARSEYIRFRHKVSHGFIRFVLVVDTDTREILSFGITDEKTGEAPQFEGLAREALDNAGIGADGRVEEPQTAGRAPRDGRRPKAVMRADGGFDSHRIFDLCAKLGITPYIRVGPNSATRSRGVGRARTSAVLDQLGGGIRDPRKFAYLTGGEKEANRRRWKERVDYGTRWLVEIVISSFKRLFGDFVRAVRWENVVQEMSLKVDVYNRMLRVHREAVATT